MEPGCAEEPACETEVFLDADGADAVACACDAGAALDAYAPSVALVAVYPVFAVLANLGALALLAAFFRDHVLALWGGVLLCRGFGSGWAILG